jgi:integrase
MEYSIDDDKLLGRFFRKRGQKQITIDNYIYTLKLWKKATGHTITTAVEEAEEEEDKGIRLRRRKIEKHLDTYHQYMESRGLSPETIQHNIMAIRTIYRFYNIQLPDPPKNIVKKESMTVKDLPGREHILYALKHSNIQYQAIILLMTASGMGRSEIINLTLKDFIEALQTVNNKISIKDLRDIDELQQKLGETIPPLTWKITRHKTGKNYITFNTSESTKAILTYLHKKPPLNYHDKNPLFRGNGGGIKPISFNQYFRDLNKRCGWSKQGYQIFFRSHNLRKYFANQLENTSLGYINTRRLLGHESLDGTARRYFKPDTELLRKLYHENMDALTIQERVEVHNLTDEAIQRLEEENRQLKEDMERVKRLIQMEGIDNKE